MANNDDKIKKLHEMVKNKPKEWRLGQAYFNYAYEMFKYEANKLRGTDRDCFYYNERIPLFLEALDELLSTRDKENVFDIYNSEGFVRSVEVNSLDDIKNLPERLVQTNKNCWEPPYDVIINFENKQIRIYDFYLE